MFCRQRPSKEDLKQKNILHGEGPLAAREDVLKTELTKAAVQHGLEHRPTAEELKQQNILKGPNAATAEHLEHQMIADKLHHKLE